MKCYSLRWKQGWLEVETSSGTRKTTSVLGGWRMRRMEKDNVGEFRQGQIILAWWTVAKSLPFILEAILVFYSNGTMGF